MATKRRTQQERRAETRATVLEGACQLFGEKGYSGTSLEDIANYCGLTTRPVYHYFGNKKQLFSAVTEDFELRLAETIRAAAASVDQSSALGVWRSFLVICEDPHFRQIVLIDAPTILGRERWAQSSVVIEVRNLMQQLQLAMTETQNELLARMLISAFAEAAIMIGESGDIETYGKQAYDLMQRLFHNIDLSNPS